MYRRELYFQYVLTFLFLDLNQNTNDVKGSRSFVKEMGESENISKMKLMSPPKFLQSLKVTHIVDIYHISCGTSDRIWVSNKHELILVNTNGKIRHHREDMFLEMV